MTFLSIEAIKHEWEQNPHWRSAKRHTRLLIKDAIWLTP
jgi:hypothetical protein